MKKFILIGVALGLLISSLPAVATAFPEPIVGCNWTCRLSDLNCKWSCDCPKLYRVSYFDENHDWVTEYVYAFNREQAKRKLGVTGGCIVGRAIGY